MPAPADPDAMLRESILSLNTISGYTNILRGKRKEKKWLKQNMISIS